MRKRASSGDVAEALCSLSAIRVDYHSLLCLPQSSRGLLPNLIYCAQDGGQLSFVWAGLGLVLVCLLAGANWGGCSQSGSVCDGVPGSDQEHSFEFC